MELASGEGRGTLKSEQREKNPTTHTSAAKRSQLGGKAFTQGCVSLE